MDIAGTALDVAVSAAIGVLILWFLKGRFEQVGARFDEMAGQMDRRFAEVNGRIDTLQTNLLSVALRVGAQPEGRAESG